MKGKQSVNILRNEKKNYCGCFLEIFQYLPMLCGTSWEVLKDQLFQWGHLKTPVNFNVKFHIKKSVYSCFRYMLYSIGEMSSKPGQTSKMKLFQKK